MQKKMEIIDNSLFSNLTPFVNTFNYQEIIYMNSIITQNNLDLIFFKLTKLFEYIKLVNLELEIEIENRDNIDYCKFISSKKKVIKKINLIKKNKNIRFIILPIVIVENSLDEFFHNLFIIIDTTNKSISRCSNLANIFINKNNNTINKILNKFFSNNFEDFTFHELNNITNLENYWFDIIDLNTNINMIFLNKDSVNIDKDSNSVFIINCYNWVFTELWNEFNNFVNYHRLICNCKENKIQLDTLDNLLNTNSKKLINLSVDGLTALHLSCQKGYYLFSKKLIDFGADINLRSEYGLNYPLHLAIKFRTIDSDHYSIIKYLIEKDVNINIFDETFTTPIFLAAAKNDIQTVNLLLNKNADLNTKTITSKNIIHYICSTPEYFKLSSSGYTTLIDTLLNEGIKLDDIDIDDRTPLHMACKNLNYDIVNNLINFSKKYNYNIFKSIDKYGLDIKELTNKSIISSIELNNYILNKDILVYLKFANINENDSDNIIETKLINHFLKQQELILNQIDELDIII